MGNARSGNYPIATDAPSLSACDSGAVLDGGAGKRLAFVELPGESRATKDRLPLAVVTGTHPGPSVWINASLHGDEYLGAASVLELFRRLKPVGVRGRVILTPVLNLSAFRAMQREDTVRGRDWNRIWLSSRGTLPAAVSWAREELLDRADLVLDLHSGGNRFLQAPFAVYPRVGGSAERRSAALAKACGLPWIWAHRGSILEGGLIVAAARERKAAALLEIAGEGKAEPTWVRGTLAAVRGALTQAGVVPGRVRFRRSYQVFRGFTVLRNREEGLWTRAVGPAGEVRRGGVLGHVHDPLGREIETVRSPVHGVVMGICTYGFVPAGDYAAEVAHGFRAEGPPAG